MFKFVCLLCGKYDDVSLCVIDVAAAGVQRLQLLSCISSGAIYLHKDVDLRCNCMHNCLCVLQYLSQSSITELLILFRVVLLGFTRMRCQLVHNTCSCCS